MPTPFHVKLTADFFDAAGRPKYEDIGLSVLQGATGITHDAFAAHRPEIGADQLAGANGVIVLTPKVTAQSVSAAADLLAVGRFGVGYDSVDVKACTAADVAVYITAGAVDRPVAEATVGWMIALTHHVRVKDRLVRTGGWDTRSRYMGGELRDRTLGLVGLGGIARTVLQLLAGWGMKPPLVFDPFIDAAAAARAGARLVSLDELLRESDFVSLHCPLTEQTRGLIGAAQLARMKPTAYLINTARGGIVDEAALYEALKSGRLAGAALDCFAVEPVVTPPPLAELDNVLLAPHCIAWTNELFRDIGRAAAQGMADLAAGQRPRGVVNPEVFDRPGFQAKWRRLCG
ncbi:MAG: hydroxyacid dehydrogenase [Verrucomicrobia bacterium]|nr:hydroxyacid dehydrogenase [Verrucomicrobiota bacterium]